MPRSVTPSPKQPAVRDELEFDPFADESGVHDLPPASTWDEEPVTAKQKPADVALLKALSTPVAPARVQIGRMREAVTQPAPPSSHQPPRPAAERVTSPAQEQGDEPATESRVTALLSAESERAIVLLSRRMHERFTEGDYEQALQSAGEILALQPAHAEAIGYQRSCERVLEQRHVQRLGDLGSIPELAVSQEQVRWLALDHREGFILSLVDGVTSVEEIFDIAGMSRLDVLKTLTGLKEADVIRLRAR